MFCAERVHGGVLQFGGKMSDIVDLSVNINPYGPSSHE